MKKWSWKSCKVTTNPESDGINTYVLFIYLYFISNVLNVELCKILPSLNRFPQANNTSWKWLNIKVYSRSTWFHFELTFFNFLDFYEKSPCKKKKVKLFWWTRKTLNIFENIPEKKLKAIGAVLGYSKPRIFFVG